MDSKLRHFIEEVRKAIYLLPQYDSVFSLHSVDSNIKQSLLRECTSTLHHNGVPNIDCLKCLRILTRDESSLQELCADDVVDLLYSYAFCDASTYHESVVTEALKALSNVIFQRSTVIDRLKKSGLLLKLVDRLDKNCSDVCFSDVLLLDLKVLFLVSSLDHSLRPDIVANSHRIFQSFLVPLEALARKQISLDNINSVSELLKTAYNVAYAVRRSEETSEDIVSVMNRMTSTLRDLLLLQVTPTEAQLNLHRQIVHFLNVVPRCSLAELIFPIGGSTTRTQLPMSAVTKLIEFLDQQLNLIKEVPFSNLDEVLCPIVALLTEASRGTGDIRKYCRQQILPRLADDVKRLPEEGPTLRNRLCQLLTNPSHSVSESVAYLLFVLCKENISRAVKYTGFGNFSGFLTRNALVGLPSRAVDREAGETSYSSTSSDSETEVFEKLKEDVNPVTGRWELNRHNPMEGMTEEQKEYLAMELVNKIDRLQREGIIQPGTVEDGRVRAVDHVLELLKDHESDQKDGTKRDVDSDG